MADKRGSRSGSRIVVNGKVFDSLESVPPELRAAVTELFADRDGDGWPDVLGSVAATRFERVTSTFEVDGRTYGSLDEVPEPHRSRLRERLAELPEAAAVLGRDSTRVGAARSGGAHTIVTSARWSRRGRLLAALVMVDVVVAVGVIWWLVR